MFRNSLKTPGNIIKYLFRLLVFIPGWFGTHLCAQPIEYHNPLMDGLTIADPFVLHHEGTYYLYGTSASGQGFNYWISENLVDWKGKGFAFKKADDGWSRGNFWAPEVISYKNKFYMAYSAKGKTMNGTGMRICVAIADHPSGPFKELYAPLFDYNFSCIDAHIFIDEQTPYLYYEKVGSVGEHWNNNGYLWGMIYGVPLAEDLSKPVQEPTLCLYPNQEWEGIHSMKARSNEGMTVFKRDGRYLMTYSGNHYADPNYGVGYATADKPLGMWVKYSGNPILKNNLSRGISGPGHNSVLQIPGSDTWVIFYHTHADPENPSAERVLNLDQLTFDEKGLINNIEPTRTINIITTEDR
ncbi:MAG: glycoside hydrolase family 43 protein [Candidatus Cyclobacteriaceae bacterium M3_2C_046]